MLRAAVAAPVVLALLVVGTASAREQAPPFAAAEIARVVDAGLMAPSVAAFRPRDPLTASELATVVASLGGAIAVSDPDAPVTVRELHAQLVTLAGLRSEARSIRLAAAAAGLSPRPWVGTETVARMLGLRFNHPQGQDELELQVTQIVTRAEAAYSIAVYLALDDADLVAVRSETATFTPPSLTDWQQVVLTRALRFVGSPYVWAGMSERRQQLFGRVLPGGFDCSGFVWRVYKAQPFDGAPQLTGVPARIVVALGADIVTGLTATAASLGNVGPGFNQVGPMASYADLHPVSRVALTLAMWIGRLEVLTVLVVLRPEVWRSGRWAADSSAAR